MLSGVNIWAVIVAAAVALFVLGGIWYSPKVFGGIWKRESGLLNVDCKKTHGPKAFIVSFILSLVSAFVFALFLGEAPPFAYSVGSGLIVGVCWVATSFGINYSFAGRNWKMLLIDSGYHILQFVIYGAILGLWH